MILPTQSELLGASQTLREVPGAGFETVLRLEAGAHRNLVEHIVAGGAKPRVYLLLENIQGTRDATVLNAYLGLPDGALPGEHAGLLGGSVGLYGLRRASLRHDPDGGSGLSFVLDVTEIFLGLPPARSLKDNEVRVSVVPRRTSSGADDLLVGRVALFWQGH